MKLLNKFIDCKIYSPKETLFSDDIASASFNSPGGQVEILPQHAEAFFLINKGGLNIKTSKGTSKSFNISEGHCFIKDDKLVILTKKERGKE